MKRWRRIMMENKWDVNFHIIDLGVDKQ